MSEREELLAAVKAQIEYNHYSGFTGFSERCAIAQLADGLMDAEDVGMRLKEPGSRLRRTTPTLVTYIVMAMRARGWKIERRNRDPGIPTNA
jgi:hypothetical protein